MKTLFAAFTLFAFSCTTATADATPPPVTAPAAPQCLVDGKPADPDALSAAGDLLTQSKTAERMSAIIDAILPSMLEMVRNLSKENKIPDTVLAAFATEFRTEMNASIPEVLSETSCLYVQHYSLTELRELHTFYNTPLGEKLISEAPTIARESLALGQAWGTKVGVSSAQHVIEKLRAEGMKI